ncbi:carcinoembryonic antigen-related cell adhesion molecule 19-like [Tiliqua scincoides]|uniref:carcinoembryonic antigen-related cell adhesion molecule 19-like n=1 Tax=Tiliqua scincoides TaxID=71010 RepID=UPI003462D170
MEDLAFQGLFSKGLLLTACLLCFRFSLIQANQTVSVVVIPETPVMGQNVTLSVQNVTGNIRQIDWYRGKATDGGTRIFTYFPGNSRPQRNGVQFTQREFGFPNGSFFISGVQPSDALPYTVLILLRSRKTLKGSIDLHLEESGTNPPLNATTSPAPAIEKPTKASGMLGWIVAGVMVGILLAGAGGAIMIYRFVLKKAEPCTGVAGKLDPRGKKPLPSKHNDKEPIYEVMDSPVESPDVEGKQLPPISGPLPPLPVPCPKPDSNYTELLHGTESIYSEIKR